jgi:ankyrin repeat protein
VTGTKTYSMRIARTPSANEGMTALHVAAQSGRADLVRYLLAKGANPAIVDGNGRKPIDLVGGNAAAPAGPAAGRAGGRAAQTDAASIAEIRALLVGNR